jgi:hypothetical protein
MRELELAGIPSFDAPRPRRDGRAHFSLSRTAFVASIVVHVLAAYALSRHVWTGPSLPPPPSAEFFLFERPAPPAREAVPAEVLPEAVPEVTEEREAAPAPRPVQPAPEPTIVVEPPPAVEPAPQSDVAPAPAPRAYIDFDEERRRAANQVIGSREAENEYLTFSMDDVVPARPEREPEPKRSIFDGTGEPIGPKVGTLGQSRTRFGRRLSEVCNALTGGFSLMGFGSFCAPPPDGSPSGLFPEVRPAYLDLMPECVDTRDTAPALALEAPFPTVKCRLVEQEEIPDELP